MKVEELITEMQTVKQAHPTLELTEILKMFEIKSIQELTVEIRRTNNG